MSESLEFAKYVLEWIGVHASVVLVFLLAVVPVMALAIAGYAIHLLGQREKQRRR